MFLHASAENNLGVYRVSPTTFQQCKATLCTHIVQYFVSLVAVDGVDLVGIVNGMVTELVLDSRQLGTGLGEVKGQEGKK